MRKKEKESLREVETNLLDDEKSLCIVSLGHHDSDYVRDESRLNEHGGTE